MHISRFRSAFLSSLVLALVSCAPRAKSVPAEHPANPDAPIGRLAGPPAALVAAAPQLNEPNAGGEHQGHGAPEPAKPANPAGEHQHAAPTDPPKPDLKDPEPKTDPKAEPTAPKKSPPKPEPKKAPAPKKAPDPKKAPEPDPHQGHDMHKGHPH